MIEVVNITGMHSEFFDNDVRFVLAPLEKKVVNDDFINRYRGLIVKTSRVIDEPKADHPIINPMKEKEKVEEMTELDKSNSILVSEKKINEPIKQDVIKYKYMFSKGESRTFTIVESNLSDFCRDNNLVPQVIFNKFYQNSIKKNDGIIFVKGWTITRSEIEQMYN